MGKQYKPKPKTGAEYVEAAKKFHAYVNFTLSKLPEEWGHRFAISETISSLARSSQDIKDRCIRANAVYMGSKEEHEMIDGLEKRMTYLAPALREFEVFDSSFEDLMSHVDLLRSERTRLDSILFQILRENGLVPVKYSRYPLSSTPAGDNRPVFESRWAMEEAWFEEEQKNPVSRKRLNGKTGQAPADEKQARLLNQENSQQKFSGISAQPKIIIEVHEHISDIEYTSADGKERLKLGFTAGNRDYLLKLEKDARSGISKRLSDDRGILKNMKAKMM